MPNAMKQNWVYKEFLASSRISLRITANIFKLPLFEDEKCILEMLGKSNLFKNASEEREVF